MPDIFDVEIAASALKVIKKLPKHIVIKLQAWVDDVVDRGLRAVRKTPGYHDEPLSGKRKGQRSIRLSKGYRAFYMIDKSGKIHFVEIIEVNKHEY